MIHPVRLAVCDVMNITLQRQKPMASNSSSWMRMRLAIIKSGGEHRLARGKSNNTDVSDDNKSQQFSPSDANERRIKKKTKTKFPTATPTTDGKMVFRAQRMENLQANR